MKHLATALFLGALTLFSYSGKAMKTRCPAPCAAKYSWSETAPHVISFNGAPSTGTNSTTVYTWHFGDGQQAVGKTPSHFYGVTGTYLVCLTINNMLSNCTNSYCDTIRVTGRVPCHLSVTAVSTPTTCATCTNGSAAVAFITGGTAPFHYSWSNGDTTRRVRNLSAGVYTVCVTDANGCSACVNDTVRVHVPPCQAHFTWRQTSPNNIAFNDTSSSGTNSSTRYFWSFGDGQHAVGQNPTHQFDVPGRYLVCLTIDSEHPECESTFCDSVTVTGTVICHMVVRTITTPATSPNFNNGSDAVAFITGGTPPFTYSWSNGDSTRRIHNLAPGAYTVCVTDAHHCVVCVTDTVRRLTPPCQAHFTFTETSPNVISFNDTTSTGIHPGTRFIWSFGDGQHHMGPNPSHTYQNPGKYLVCLTIDTEHPDCESTYCDSVTVTGTALCHLVVHTASTPSSCITCSTGTASVTAVTGGTAPYVYSWSNGGLTNKITNLLPGTYTVCVTDSNNCRSCVVVSVGPNAHPGCNAAFDIHATSNDTTTTVTVTNHSTGAGKLRYTWTWGDGTPNDTSKNATHIYHHAGTFQICLTISDTTGCSSSVCHTAVALRLPSFNNEKNQAIESSTLKGWSIFPNPTNGLLQINYSIAESSDVKISVYDLTGQEVNQIENISKQTAGNHDLKMDTQSLSPGIYLISIRTSDRVETKRLVILRN